MYKAELIEIYNLLYDTFGPQYWWPAQDDFEVIVGTILTQSVAWTNVEKAIANLKNYELCSIDKILSADMEFLALLIRSTRYYNQKAVRLKDFCQHIKENYDGNINKLFEKDMDALRSELLTIKGIGKETADSIILYAAKKPIFVVDAYTRRIFSRLGYFDKDITYQKMQDFFMEHLPKNVELFNEYHALIVKLGKDCCKNKKSNCQQCPLNNKCPASRD